MKYWRGYLTAAIFAAITWVLMQMGQRFATLVDMVYPYVTRTLQNMLAQWSSSVDFVLWQVLALLLVVLVLATIVLMVILKWNPIQWFGWVLAVGSCLFMLHTALYGLNYYAGPLAGDVRLEVTGYSASELADATRYYRDKANALAEDMDRDQNGDLIFPSFQEMAEQAGDGFDVLVYDRSYSVFAGSKLPVKELGWADFFSSAGITGVTVGLTGEAAVNPQIPVVTIPFTMCHEMAHRMCINVERDANFAGFLASRFNPSPEFQYSGYFMAYRYCYNALASLGTSSANAAAQEIYKGMGDGLRHDMEQYDDFFRSNKDEAATKVMDTANDTYIKASGDEQGLSSYDQVYDLLVNWYIQEIVVPMQTDVEIKFDPYDEAWVDSNGASEAGATEAVEP